MNKLLVFLFLLSFTVPSFAAPLGGPDMSIPEGSFYLKESAVKKTLDIYDYNMNIKAIAEIEIIIDRNLTSADADTANAELKGQTFMLKFSNNFNNLFEPYVKIGTCNFEAEWIQHRNQDLKVKMEGDSGFAWCMGAKAKLIELEDSGVKLTLDAQYRNIDLHVDSAKIDDSTLTASAADQVFEIKEWQIGLLASKKYIFTLKRDYYIVPYAGITFSELDVDASFTQSTTAGLYSTYNASDENVFGLVFGCDMMPSLLSWYLFNVELRLLNETALNFGGTMKF